MEGMTLFVGLAASAFVLLLSPIYGFVVYVGSLAWYPSFLSVQVGTIDFTVRRMVIIALFAKLFLQTDLSRRFKFIWLDKIMIMYFLAQFAAGAVTVQSLGAFFENRVGAMFDMVLPYFAVRMIVRNKTDYITLLKGMLIVAAPLAVIGFYQCITGTNLLGFLRARATIGGASYTSKARLGLFRATAVFPHAIIYGLFFATLAPICAGILRTVKNYRGIYFAGIALLIIGVFSSMSSGPFLAALLSAMFIAVYWCRKYWKPIVAMIIIMCGSVEIISNRHFYDVLGSFTLNPATAYYRSRLIDVALFEGGMSGHWLTGYGYNTDPGWGPRIDGRRHTDTVNHYILVLSRYGLVGLIPFLAMNIAAVQRLVQAYNTSTGRRDRWLIWCLSGGYFGLVGALMSVALFGQADTVYYVLLGFAGVMPAVVHVPQTERWRRLLHRYQQLPRRRYATGQVVRARKVTFP
jgi:hypothetical protein